MKKLTGVLIGLILLKCNGSSFVQDTSIDAVNAYDYTAIMAACSPMAGQGADICRVHEGAEITQVWSLVVPKNDRILGGELTVTFRGNDFNLSIPPKGGVIEIPLKSVLGHDVWEASDRGSAVALLQVKYQSDTESEAYTHMRGLVIFAVLDAGYQPLPVDGGGPVAFKSTCIASFTTAGRTSLVCK